MQQSSIKPAGLCARRLDVVPVSAQSSGRPPSLYLGTPLTRLVRLGPHAHRMTETEVVILGLPG